MWVGGGVVPLLCSGTVGHGGQMCPQDARTQPLPLS